MAELMKGFEVLKSKVKGANRDAPRRSVSEEVGREEKEETSETNERCTSWRMVTG